MTPEDTRRNGKEPSPPSNGGGSVRLGAEPGRYGLGPRLVGKVAVVTGGARGIGAAIVRLFLAHGARVVVADRDADAGYALLREEERKADPPAHGGAASRASFVRLDVTDEESWAKAMQQVRSTYDRLDVLVNCAGVFSSSASVSETAVADFDRVLGTNARGTFLGIKHGSREMKGTRAPTPDGGAIINVSSVAGKVGVAQMAAYCTSKGAVAQLTRAAALDLARHSPPIRCTALCPIWVQTDMLAVVQDQLGPVTDDTANPMRKILQPDDVAFAALFLASAEARFITGTDIVIDGGYTAQ